MIRETNKIRSKVRATVVHDNDFESGRVGLLAEGLQTLAEKIPVVVDNYDNAEFRS
jgi:hypothetical protein